MERGPGMTRVLNFMNIFAFWLSFLLAAGLSTAQTPPPSSPGASTPKKVSPPELPALPYGAHPKLNLQSGRSQSWHDAPTLRLQPGIEIRTHFRLSDLGFQSLAYKDAEYFLRVNGPSEGGNLAFFIQIDGKWEPRLLGPVVRAGADYDVRAWWSGMEMGLEVNGESFRSRREGNIRAGEKPLVVGPVTGTLDDLTILNPAHERSLALAAQAQQRSGEIKQTQFGGEAGWKGWTGAGGATCDPSATQLGAQFPSAQSMLVSPPLSCDVAALPFICLDVQASGPGWTGHLDLISDAGKGSIAFEPMTSGRTTVVSGTASDAWMGTLRRIGLSFSGGTGTVTIKRLMLSDRAVGNPWFYIQDFAAGRAKLRPGREETVIAGIKNLGGETEDIRVRLEAPEGIEILGAAEQRIPYLGKDDFDMATWRIRASKPGGCNVRMTVSAAGAETHDRDLSLEFEPLPELKRTGYVPEPLPAKTDYIGLMHYCALWKEGTHTGWKRIEPWPSRRPAIGWYDEGTPEVADWHIKYALEHGINGFIYCWYRAHLEPKIEHTLGHAIHDGLLEAKYRDRFKFCIMWENGCAVGVKDADDLLDNVLPYWITNYFTQPSYLKLDNMPLLLVWQPRKLIPQLGGPEGTRKAFERMRARCREAGFAGLRLIACMDGPNEKLGSEIASSGWDAVTGYCVDHHKAPQTGIDPDGIPYHDYTSALRSYKDTWSARAASTGLPDIPNVMMGWDPRPWHRGGGYGYIADPRPGDFESACRDAKALVDAKPADRWDRKLVVFDNWTEFGEGHYIEPASSLGFSYVNAIKRVFCKQWASEALTDVIPEDLGLVPPQARYEAVRASFGSRMPWQPLRIRGDLLAFWQFDAEKDGAYPDSSPNDCQLKAVNVRLEPGRQGMALRCGDGAATRSTPAPFFNPGGIAVALWCKPSEGNQSDRWMINTVAESNSGYRLGLSGGRPVWQVPVESWSHGLTATSPLPVNEWSFVAATVDQQMMRLYVNGQEVGSLPRRGFIKPGREICVGGYGTTMERACFRGWLDDVRLYRRPLSATEIARLAGRAEK